MGEGRGEQSFAAQDEQCRALTGSRLPVPLVLEIQSSCDFIRGGGINPPFK